MRVQTLNLTHFRNYERLLLDFSPGKNLFLGNNGQGKTNLLEALYFLSHARSHRTSTDRELVQAGQPFATVSAQLSPHHYEGRTLLEAQIQLQGDTGENARLRTVFKLNASPLKSRSEVLGHLPTVSFFLPDLLLLRGTPEDRRNWLDAAIVQYDKRHLYYLKDFHKIRQQKNRLLKEAPELISREHLETWNVQFAHAGAKVIQSRLDYLGMIEDYAAITYLELSDAQEKLGMRYQSTVVQELQREKPDGHLLEEIEAVLNRQLQLQQNDEIRRGTSLVGPHRDDIQFYLNGMDASAYGSQGQQRSVVLALKLTELKCLNAKLQEPPVLLLDDVMAELDPDRQRLLVFHMDPESQVMITTTHPTVSWMPLLEAHGPGQDIRAFQVTAGTVQSYDHWQNMRRSEGAAHEF